MGGAYQHRDILRDLKLCRERFILRKKTTSEYTMLHLIHLLIYSGNNNNVLSKKLRFDHFMTENQTFFYIK